MTLRNLARRLRRNRSGVAMVEFAIGAPFLLMAGLWGSEMANYALVTMRISQLAEHVADNASRVGDTSTLQNRRIYESDINEVIYGAQLQGGTGLDLYENGRVIVSSVQVSPAGNQYIHWQRCRGAKNIVSDYGAEGADLGSEGIGPEGEEVQALPDDALIFVELNYTYQPLVSERFLGSLDIKAIASFMVRDDRDISQIYQRDPASPDPVQTCNQFKGRAVVETDGDFT
ncbi:MAG: pilus assembly protein [Sphingomonadales bacterium]|nr:pilus assembly protein [Sphingomonadaceae bacterium]MBS3930548.1 pilus assembly protein [Sphingomonadales bacterium]